MKRLRTEGKRHPVRRALRWAAIVAGSLMAFSVLMVLVYRFVNPPCTILMLSRSLDGIERREGRWIPYAEIPQTMIDAVVASEDNKFADHFGFDFGEMRTAYNNNRKGRKLRGASTITQQMCKNVFLWERRSYLRKGLEAWFTLWVELLWSKERILEVYLNVIETGPGLYGIDAASQTYYRHSAVKLSISEAAMIATTLPAPRKRIPSRPSVYMLKRQAQIIELMKKIGKVSLD